MTAPNADPDAGFTPVFLNYDELADRLYLTRPRTGNHRRELLRILWERHVLADMDEEARRPPEAPRTRAQPAVASILPPPAGSLPAPTPKPKLPPAAPTLPRKPVTKWPSSTESRPARFFGLAARIGRATAQHPQTHNQDINFIALPFPLDVTPGQLRHYLNANVSPVANCRLSDGIACITLAPRGKGAIEACKILNGLTVDGCRLSAFPVRALRHNKPAAQLAVKR